MLRRRRGELASINAEIRDGLQVKASLSAPRRPGYRFVALIIACALFMEQMDATVLATALPTLARDFAVPVTELSSALTSYLLALAIFIPASGLLADRFGSKTVFRLAILVFVAGSALCGQAHSLPFLVLARFVQGLGGAMVIPIGRLVLLRSVAREDMVNAMSWLIIPALIGPIIGPPLGGYIITYLSWRWIFYLNLPIGVLGLILVTRFIDQVRSPETARFDVRGFGLSGLSLGCLLFGFESLSRPGEALAGGALLLLGLSSGFLYVLHARSVDHPILDLSLLRISTFRLSLLAGSLTRITQGAQPFLLPMMLQVGFGLSAASSGALTIAGAVSSLAMKWVAPGILRRFGFRRSLVVNGLLASAGYAACALFRPAWPIAAIFLVLSSAGFFMSFQFTAYNTIAYDEIAPERMSSATSFYATFQQLMLSAGICVAAVSLHLSMVRAHSATPHLGDFSVAFLVVSGLSTLATVWNLRFAADAGQTLSGHASPPSRRLSA